MSDVRQPETGAQPARGRRWPWILLILSLAFNLLFVGLVAGAVWTFRHGGWGGPRHHAFASSLRRVMKELPDERRKVAEEIVTRHRARIRPLRRQVHEARHAALQGLEADPFDEAGLKRKIEQLQSAEARLHKTVAGLVMELMKELTAEERRLFVRTVMRKRFGRHGRPRDGDRWHPKEGP